MRIWTSQPVPVYNELLKNGIFRCDPAKATWLDEPIIADAYAWLCQQMTSRIGPPPHGVEFPIWAWHTRNWKHKKPDLRESDMRNYPEPMVLMELEIPDDQVLLSDEDLWYHVLSKWLIDDSTNEEEWDAIHRRLDSLPPAERESQIIASWEKIFDIISVDNDWYCRGRFVQATFWEIRMEYLKHTWFYNAKQIH